MLKAFKSHAQSIVDGVRGGQRKWFDAKTGPLDIAGMHTELFDRDELNGKYAECMRSTTSGTVADVIVIKRQVDYMAAAERAHRCRQATFVRRLGHAVARRQAQAKGGAFDSVEQVLSQTLRAGGTSG